MAGGTGLIGTSLASSLVSGGHQVWVLSRHPATAKVPGNVNVEKWDGYLTKGWDKLAAGMDAIINLAGESIGAKPWTEKQKESILTSRLNAGKAVTEALTADPEKAKTKILVQASAVGYYGPSGEAQLDENSPAGMDFLAGVCQKWEASTKRVEDFGVRRMIIRTGLVLSLSGGVLPRMLMPFRLFAGGPVGSGRQWYSWIHLDDEVEAIRFLIEHPTAAGVYNLTSPEPVTNAVFGHTIAKVMKRPYWIPAPSIAFRVALGEMSTLVLDGQRVSPTNLLEAGYGFKFTNLEDALKDLFRL